MKYTIEGLQQKALIEMNCDAVDAIILRFIIDFFNSGCMKILIVESEKDSSDNAYFWVHYDTIINEIPIIEIKKQALRDRLDKYVVNKLMDKKVVKDKTGTYTYFKFIKDKYDTLVRESASTGIPLPVPTGSPLPVRTGIPLPPIDSSTTIDSSITDISIVEFLFSVWISRKELLNHKFESVKKNIKKKHLDIIKDVGKEKSYVAINNYADILKSKDHFFNYKWTFWDFIARGLYRFVDEAEPFHNFSSKKEQPKDEDKEKFLKQLKD